MDSYSVSMFGMRSGTMLVTFTRSSVSFSVRYPPNGFTIAQREAGQLQYTAADVVYGSRLDIVEKYNLDQEKWGNVPSMAYGLGLRLYYGSKITGHPYIGYSKGVVLPLIGHLILRPFAFGLSYLFFYILFGSKTNGRYGWLFVGLAMVGAIVLQDVYVINLSTSYHIPRGELGALNSSAGIRDTDHPIRPAEATASMQSFAHLRRSSIRSTLFGCSFG